MDLGIEIILGYFATGTLWGVTNALMEVGSKEESKDVKTKKKGKATDDKSGGNVLTEGMKMFANLSFLLPFILNQLASVLNNFLVAKSDLSIAVPVVNCITFQVTFITMRLLKGTSLIDFRFLAGSLLIMTGLYLCLTK